MKYLKEIKINEIDSDRFIVVCWPEIQNYMILPRFEENSILINDGPLLDEFGSSSYLVRERWIASLE